MGMRHFDAAGSLDVNPASLCGRSASAAGTSLGAPMNVLTVFAHSGSRSLCHALLERFDAGLRAAGHANEVVDLYAIGFDPVIRERDGPNWMDPDVPEEILARMNLRQSLLDGASGPFSRFATRRLVGDRDDRAIIRLLQERYRPKDVAVQQAKVARAQALAFIAPVYFVGFPAILKGWIERVFTLGFAFGLTPAGWRGDLRGRVPLLSHEKALIMQTTLFDQHAYQDGLAGAMKLLVAEYCLHYPGIKTVEHVLFHAVYGADDATRRGYLDQAYRLGREF
jgi:NAD(P)H dehydrogenase (quinone)